MPTMVSFHTNGWIQDCITSYLRVFPGNTILVVDNNPHEHDNFKVKFYYEDQERPELLKSAGVDSESRAIEKDGHIVNSTGWNRQCEKEREWLRQHSNVILIPIPIEFQKSDAPLSHGEAMDVAVQWLLQNDIPIMLYLEPDSLVTDRGWYDNLCQAIKQSMGCAYTHDFPYGAPSMCGSIWRLPEIKFSFGRALKSPEEQTLNLFDAKLMDEKATMLWETGNKNWYEFKKVGRAIKVGGWGLRHLWGGTVKPHA